MENTEKTIPKWAERELTRHAMNSLNTHNDDYEIHVEVALDRGIKTLENGGSIDEAFIDMNLYLSTID